MKTNLLFITVISLIIFSCNNAKNENEAMPTNTHTLAGTWEHTSTYKYVNGKINDTVKAKTDSRQIKIYTASKIMWCKHVKADSTDWFGYGNYTIKGDTLIEVLEYGSGTMMPHIAYNDTFTFSLDLNEDRYSQLTIDDKGNKLFAENYRRIK